MSNLDRAFDDLIGNEGGYSCNPADPGGETIWGVTKKTAVANGYQGAMQQMTKAEAKEIYRLRYWQDWMDNLEYAVAFNIFDMTVNSGLFQAVKTSQLALGISPDGVYGPRTGRALLVADPVKFVARFNAFRQLFLTDLPTWPNFGKGWSRRLANNTLKTVV